MTYFNTGVYFYLHLAKNDIFHNFMYDACDKLWGHDIITSLKWIFIRTGQELFPENMGNFKNSYLPYFLSDFYDFCTILLELFFSVLWNDDNFGPDFLFKFIQLYRIMQEQCFLILSFLRAHPYANYKIGVGDTRGKNGGRGGIGQDMKIQ